MQVSEILTWGLGLLHCLLMVWSYDVWERQLFPFPPVSWSKSTFETIESLSKWSKNLTKILKSQTLTPVFKIVSMQNSIIPETDLDSKQIIKMFL